MQLLKTLLDGLGRLAYESTEEGGKQNWGEWDEAPDVVRRVHHQMAVAVAKEVLRRVFDERTLFEIEHADLSNSCMDMIREDFERMGMDMSGSPPMMYPEAMQSLMYPEAMQSLLYDRLKEAGVFPGHAATVRYEATDDPNRFQRVSVVDL